MVVEGLESKLGHLPGGLWTESSQSAVACPIFGSDRRAVGMLVLGVNVRRALDDDYMYFPASLPSKSLPLYTPLLLFIAQFHLFYLTNLFAEVSSS